MVMEVSGGQERSSTFSFGYRHVVLTLLFFMTTINYADRATLSITGAAIQDDLGINSVVLGWLFAAFAWSYVLAQIPAGTFLDRLGSRLTYTLGIGFWSLFTFTMGFVAGLPAATAIVALFGLRLLIGFAEAPVFPANNRVTLTWFPDAERGTTTAVFTAAQYFAKVVFAPLMGYITQYFGWNYVYLLMGIIGGILVTIFWVLMRPPRENPRVSRDELSYIEANGATVDMDSRRNTVKKPVSEVWREVRKIVSSRMMIGVLVGQYCMATLTVFFLTWLPLYLIDERHFSIAKAGLVSAIPAISGLAGGLLGGLCSDFLIRRGYSISFARKAPIVLGMTLSGSLILCNYTDSTTVIVSLMAFAFFAKAFGVQGWAVLCEIAPKESVGLAASLLNGFGNLASVIAPIAIGYMVHLTGGFFIPLVFVSAHGIAAALIYLFFVGKLRRINLDGAPSQKAASQA